jgi:antitoxin (DNA-binding transcriptional repressor) of toxin-antitoxin stability system
VSEKEIGVEEARKTLGNLVDDAAIEGAVTYLTRRGRRYAAIVPLDRIKETAMPARVYIRETDEGTEVTKVFQSVNEIREVFEVDGEIVDDSIVYADSDPDEYLRRRDMELRGEGYRKS